LLRRQGDGQDCPSSTNPGNPANTLSSRRMSSNRRISRRAFVQTAAVPIVAAAASASPRKKRSSMHVAVIGAGAFGGWTALHLLRGGARVTLVDALGAGNDRASSGGETRVIR